MARFQFTARSLYSDNLMAMLPLQIHIGARFADIIGMIDSAAAVNVLPYSLGSALGAVWDEQQILGNLTGALSRVETRALAVHANSPKIEGAQDVALLFAWAKTDEVPVLFGQLNFLMEFNACFYRSQNYFEVWRA